MIGNLDETIAAIASATGGAARGIVRLSGPDVVTCLEKCFRPTDAGELPRSGRPVVITGDLAVRRPAGTEMLLPSDLFLWPTARSYTRQPAAELHTIGSPPLMAAALHAICRAGARLAEPGEFTLRAFLAGRIDLAQAEAVLGVVDARDDGQLQTALRQLAGGLSRPLADLRDDIVGLLADLEAGLDFADEDIEFVGSSEVVRRLSAASEKVTALAVQLQTRGDAGGAIRVVLVGPPNAGKSSLFNALAARYGAVEKGVRPFSKEGLTPFSPRDRRGHPAIVSPVPGTTRDYLVARLELDGVACELVDTAGAGARRGPAVDRAAQAQASELRANADVVIDCRPVDLPAHPTDFWPIENPPPPSAGEGLGVQHSPPPSAGERLGVQHSPPPSAGEGLGVGVCADLPRRISVVTKADLSAPSSGRHATGIATSSLTGAGLADLAVEIRRHAAGAISSHPAAVATTAARCRESLREAATALDRAGQLAEDQRGDELVAAEIRTALHELGTVVGTVYTDDILDRIFGAFCVGK